jgi:hypothetical protein
MARVYLINLIMAKNIYASKAKMGGYSNGYASRWPLLLTVQYGWVGLV